VKVTPGLKYVLTRKEKFLTDKEDFAGEWRAPREVSNSHKSGGGAKIVGDYSTIGCPDV
jgi:hypothetical protein